MNILIIEDEPAIARRTQRITQSILGGQIQAIPICNSVDPLIRKKRLQPSNMVYWILYPNLSTKFG